LYLPNFNKLVSTANKCAFQPKAGRTRECLHLVTRLHFRSRDKDGGHTIRSAVVESPMLHTDFTAPCFIERKLFR